MSIKSEGDECIRSLVLKATARCRIVHAHKSRPNFDRPTTDRFCLFSVTFASVNINYYCNIKSDSLLKLLWQAYGMEGEKILPIFLHPVSNPHRTLCVCQTWTGMGIYDLSALLVLCQITQTMCVCWIFASEGLRFRSNRSKSKLALLFKRDQTNGWRTDLDVDDGFWLSSRPHPRCGTQDISRHRNAKQDDR